MRHTCVINERSDTVSLNKGNSKSQYSKEQMRNALLELLKEKDFDSITIQERKNIILTGVKNETKKM